MCLDIYRASKSLYGGVIVLLVKFNVEYFMKESMDKNLKLLELRKCVWFYTIWEAF